MNAAVKSALVRGGSDLTGRSTRTHTCLRALRALTSCTPVNSEVRAHGPP